MVAVRVGSSERQTQFAEMVVLDGVESGDIL